MKKFALLLLLTFVASLSHGQQRFKDFLENFTPVEEVTEGMFATPSHIGDWLDAKRFGEYLPTGNDSCECVWYRSGWRMTQDKNLIVVAFRYCDIRNCESNYNRHLAENTLTECFLLTYTAKGRLIDSARIGRDGDCYFSRVKDVATVPLSVTMELGVTDGRLFLQYTDLKYSVRRSHYVVGKDGQITKTTDDAAWEEVRQQEDATPTNTTFDAYLRLFNKVDRRTVDDSMFRPAQSKWLDYMSVSTFVPDTLDCQCYPRELSWIPCCYFETADSYVCFMETVCEYPIDEAAERYSNRLQLTYSKEGKLKDAKVVSSTHIN